MFGSNIMLMMATVIQAIFQIDADNRAGCVGLKNAPYILNGAGLSRCHVTQRYLLRTDYVILACWHCMLRSLVL